MITDLLSERYNFDHEIILNPKIIVVKKLRKNLLSFIRLDKILMLTFDTYELLQKCFLIKERQQCACTSEAILY